MKEPDILATFFVHDVGTPHTSVVFWYMTKETFEARKGRIKRANAIPWNDTDKLHLIMEEFSQSFPDKQVNICSWRDFWVLLHNAGFVEEQS